MSTPSFATVAATSAIWIGVTNVSPWPNDADASSASSANPPGARAVAVGDLADGRRQVERDRAPRSPSSAASSTRPVAAGLEPGERVPDVAARLGGADEVERRVAGLRVVAVADPEAVDDEAGPPRPRLLLEGRRRASTAPESRPAIPVTILNTDPGTYRPSVARGSSGLASSSRSAVERRARRCPGRRSPGRRTPGSRRARGPRRSSGRASRPRPGRRRGRAPPRAGGAGRATGRRPSRRSGCWPNLPISLAEGPGAGQARAAPRCRRARGRPSRSGARRSRRHG